MTGKAYLIKERLALHFFYSIYYRMATRRWVTSPDVKEESKGIVPSGGEHDEPRAAILATFVSVSMNMILMFIYVGYMPVGQI